MKYPAAAVYAFECIVESEGEGLRRGAERREFLLPWEVVLGKVRNLWCALGRMSRPKAIRLIAARIVPQAIKNTHPRSKINT
jgi:hypothetical protein